MNTQKPEAVDMFADDEFKGQFIRKNIEQIVQELSKQFRDREDAFRELLQNSIDSDTPQIDVYYQERPAERDDHVKLDIVFEDYGCGMNIFEREEYFRKLFKSSKEKNKRKIGKYGIGISSVFALDIEELYVESCGKNRKTEEKESWMMYIKDIKDRPSYIINETDERKGTKVILTKTLKIDEVAAFKQKAKEKMKYYCKRSRTPIYVEKDFINEDFDIDSGIKSYKSYDRIEFVLAVTDQPFYELHNNRLLLEERWLNFFDRWENISALISSQDLKHTFSRDAVKRDKTFNNIAKFVEKDIKSLFISAVKRIDHYAQNPFPVFDEKLNDVLLETRFRYYTLRNDRGLDRIRRKIARDKIMGNIDKEEEASLTEKVDEYEKQYYEHSRKKSEYDRLYSGFRKELELSWKFVISYITKLYNNTKRDSDMSDIKVIGCFFKGKNAASRIMSELPSETKEYKIIPTINGNISLIELLENYSKGNTVLHMTKSEPELENILNKQNKLVLRYNRLFDDPLSKLIEVIGKSESANVKYSVPCRLEDESIISEREKRFLDKMTKMLRKNYKSYISNVYFTNHSKLHRLKRDKAVVLINQFGRINIGEARKNIVSRIVRRTKDFYLLESRYDFAVNLDSAEVQKMITLYNNTNRHTSNLAFLYLKSYLEKEHSFLRSSRWENSLDTNLYVTNSSSQSHTPYSNRFIDKMGWLR